jgi:hypothetical protein
VTIDRLSVAFIALPALPEHGDIQRSTRGQAAKAYFARNGNGPVPDNLITKAIAVIFYAPLELQ